MATDQRTGRRKAVSDLKRSLILDAARKVFEAEGLDGASLRAIAAEAGYTPAALYFHFESKEAIYAELLRNSLANLREAIMLGFYLFRGGMKPRGLGKEHDRVLNAALEEALQPIADAAEAIGARREDARL